MPSKKQFSMEHYLDEIYHKKLISDVIEYFFWSNGQWIWVSHQKSKVNLYGFRVITELQTLIKL
jgi:hypothetical protein